MAEEPVRLIQNKKKGFRKGVAGTREARLARIPHWIGKRRIDKRRDRSQWWS
jgi:hypothetical protein